jgi:lysophospholipase L1-like esterase
MTIIGNLYGEGDSLIEGIGASSKSHCFLNLFSSWLNVNYGPVTAYNNGLSQMNSLQLRDFISTQLSGVTINICVLEIGLCNFVQSGDVGSSNCGGVSLLVGYSNALNYGADLNKIVSVIKSHMVPDGILMIMNIYESDDFVNVIFPGWKDYPAILTAYNKVIALVANATGSRLIDINSLLAANPSFRDSVNMHPNNKGQAAIANLLECTLEDNMKK